MNYKDCVTVSLPTEIRVFVDVSIKDNDYKVKIHVYDRVTLVEKMSRMFHQDWNDTKGIAMATLTVLVADLVNVSYTLSVVNQKVVNEEAERQFREVLGYMRNK